MFNTKYIMSNGLAFAENEEMKMLSLYAKKGWILYKFGILGYKLKKSRPQQLQYSLDYRINPDKEYFLYFNTAGWSHVCSAGNGIHIFSAQEGTKPIYTDNDTELEKYIEQYEIMKKVAIPSLLCTILSFTLTFLSKYNHVPDIYVIIFGVVSIPLCIVTVFSGLPCISYYCKINKIALNKSNVLNKNYKIIYRLTTILVLIFIVMILLNKFNFLNIGNIILYPLFFICIFLFIFICFIK